MATQRIESGQIQIRGAGNVPMVQAQPQQVDYIGPRVAAQGASQMAQILDRMSANTFQAAAEMRQQEGLQFAAQNPLTSQQVQLAKDGINPEGWFMGPNGEPAQIPTVNASGYFAKAVAKARSLELSSHFEIEGRNELTKLLADVEAGNVTSNQVQSKIETMSSGYAKSLANIDPEAGIKFRATMATHGNTVLNAAYKAELDRAKAQRIAKFDSDFDNSTRLLEATVSQGSWTDANGQQRSIDELADVFRKNVLTQSLLLGDKALQIEYSTKFEAALRTAKISGVTKALMAPENMVDPDLTLKKIQSGDLGNMSPVLKDLIVNDFDAVAKVTANFMVAVNNRKSVADGKAAEAKKQGEAQAINLLEQIFPLPDGSPKKKQLIGQLTALPEGSVPIGTLKDLLAPSGEGNAAVNFNLLAGIYNNTITDPKQIWGLVGKGITGKDAVAALKILQSEDRRDSSELDRGISQLSGIPVIPGSVVIIDPKGEEFKHRSQLQSQALQIQATAAAEGKTLTPRQILTQLEDGIAKARNTESAKAARNSLQIFEKQEWINGPITRDTLPALERKAGTDKKKLQELSRIKQLLKQSEGEQ
ncbi:hypothetical protein UFOVP628_18 [uncultured Caudovirales phage]|uniref:Uncharacterized protein n=1 Tax=uncultured Caudovirales phage TaxID=2100421 RepID=A0A6J5N274_9CAUD|nr:hypothetical protein UFOVP628_18 [uncultured Caudovirales phage]